jgi:hypothetical protein
MGDFAEHRQWHNPQAAPLRVMAERQSWDVTATCEDTGMSPLLAETYPFICAAMIAVLKSAMFQA